MKKVTITFLLATLIQCQSEREGSMSDPFPMQSSFVASRQIQVWLPPSYLSSEERFPVLYMHDGQMLFDSTTTWNKQEWGVDEVMNQLIQEKKIRETIVVGVWNIDSLRHSEYFPQKPFNSLPKGVQDSLLNLGRSSEQALFGSVIQSDKYLKFLVHELKPYLDENFRTLPGPKNTFIAGSSMGGLISMYAICEYPEVFGGAACISTHWPGTFTVDNNPIPGAFFEYLKVNLPNPKNHRVYFDYGTETLDALYESLQQEADKIIAANGYDVSNFLSKKFEGAAHDERSWNERLHIPLEFLLKPSNRSN